MERVLRINKNKVLHVSVFIILIFLMCNYGTLKLGDMVNFLWQHIDEFMVAFFIVYSFFNYQILLSKKSMLLYLWLIFLATGLLSMLLFRIQPLMLGLQDMIFAVSRFMIGYFAVFIYLSKKKRDISKDILPWCKLITVILFFLSLHDIFFKPFFIKGDYRYFIDSLMLMFQHQTYLAASASALLIFLGYCNERNRLMPYMLMISFVDFMTLRSKALGFLAIYWILYIIIILLKNNNYYVIIAVGALAGIAVGFSQLSTYYLNNNYNPRKVLLENGIKLANDYFPLGTGYATYGSALANQNYSPLYKILGFDQYYGLSESTRFYLSDNFWPIVIGQNGWIGFLIFILIIGLFLAISFRVIKVNKLSGMAMLGVLIYMGVASIAETSFFNPVSLLFFMMMAVFEHEFREDEYE